MDSGTFPKGISSVTLLCNIAALSLDTARERQVSVPILAVDIENEIRGMASAEGGRPVPGAGQLWPPRGSRIFVITPPPRTPPRRTSSSSQQCVASCTADRRVLDDLQALGSMERKEREGSGAQQNKREHLAK